MAFLSPAISFCIWLLVYTAVAGLLYAVFSKRLYRGKKRVISWGIRFAFLLILYIIVRVFFFDIYRVSGSSMEPTLVDGDYVFVSKTCYGTRLPRSLFEVPWVNLLTYLYPFNLLDHKPTQQYYRLYSKRDINRGDIVVFNMPIYQKQFGIKRCAYISRDNISTSDSLLTILPHKNLCINISNDSLSIVERRIITHYQLDAKDSIFHFHHNYYFLLGDNSEASTDSRMWGAVQDDHVVGNVKFIVFSKETNGKFRWGRFFNIVK